MREVVTQSAVVELARSLEIIARKLGFGENWPDYMFLFQGRILFIEFKSSTGKLTPGQVFFHAQLRAAGFPVHVVSDKEYGFQLIRRFYKGVDYGRSSEHPPSIFGSDDSDQ